jgi:hypothetical protein
LVALGIAMLELLAALEELAAILLSELDRLELKPTELELLELRELELARLATGVVDGLGLVPPLPPPHAVSIKLKRLAMKTELINLIIVSGIQTAPLFIML